MFLNSPKSYFDCHSEGLAYIAGYLAFKFKHEHPELGSKTSDEPLFQPDNSPWITALSRGGLMKPSDDFLMTVQQFEIEFKKFHGDGLNRCSNVTKRFAAVLESKFPRIPKDVIKKYSRVRTFIRLKDLNKNVREQKLTNRNLKQITQFRT